MTPILGITASAIVPPATGSFESIATATGTGNSAIITFSSIPSTYQHLQIRFIGKSTSTGTAAAYTMGIEYNSGGVYTAHSLTGNGATAAAFSNNAEANIPSRATIIPNSATTLANQFGVGIIDIHDYSTTNKNKTLRGFVGSDLNRTTTPTGAISLYSGMLISTSALTTIKLTVATGNWTTTSQFALYGIKGA